MRSYAERECFADCHVHAWRDAATMVARLGEWGNELRCHELARAVYRGLQHHAATSRIVVLDGHLWAQEHSWIQLTELRAPHRRAYLDVYTPGRIPQVQLLDVHWNIVRGYTERKLDVVVVDSIVEAAHAEMTRSPPAIGNTTCSIHAFHADAGCMECAYLNLLRREQARHQTNERGDDR